MMPVEGCLVQNIVCIHISYLLKRLSPIKLCETFAKLAKPCTFYSYQICICVLHCICVHICICILKVISTQWCQVKAASLGEGPRREYIWLFSLRFTSWSSSLLWSECIVCIFVHASCIWRQRMHLQPWIVMTPTDLRVVKGRKVQFHNQLWCARYTWFGESLLLLAPTGALIVILCYNRSRPIFEISSISANILSFSFWEFNADW